MKISKSTLYTIIVGLAVTVLITSNLASTKLFSFFGTDLVWDGGAIIFPLSYVLGDIVTEIYGFKGARKIVVTAFAMNLLVVLVLWLVQLLPPGVGWENQDAYEAIIGFMPRLVFGSLTAYLVGQLINAFTFAKIKVATKGKRLWVRALGSSVFGNLVDTLVFTTIAFLGVISTNQFIGLLAIAYATKMIGEIVLLPVTYKMVKFMKKITVSDNKTDETGEQSI